MNKLSGIGMYKAHSIWVYRAMVYTGVILARRMLYRKVVKGVPFLGRIPMDPRIVESGDSGRPFVEAYPDSPAATAFLEVVERCDRFLENGSQVRVK